MLSVLMTKHPRYNYTPEELFDSGGEPTQKAIMNHVKTH